MSADTVAVLVATSLCALVALVLLVVVTVLNRRVRELREMVGTIRNEALPLVRDARVVMDQAATEMERVGDVLASAEAVSETVDSASRLAYRVFANPVVKVLAYSTGTGSALRRLASRRARDVRELPASAGSSRRGPHTNSSAAPIGSMATGALEAGTSPLERSGSPTSHRRRRRARAGT